MYNTYYTFGGKFANFNEFYNGYERTIMVRTLVYRPQGCDAVSKARFPLPELTARVDG